MAKRLFALRDPQGQIIKDGFYETKKAAKAARRFLNGTTDEGIELQGHTITPGPDHRHWQS